MRGPASCCSCCCRGCCPAPHRPPPHTHRQAVHAYLCLAVWQGAAQVEHAGAAVDRCCDVAAPAVAAEAVLARRAESVLAGKDLKADHALCCGVCCVRSGVHCGGWVHTHHTMRVPLHATLCCHKHTHPCCHKHPPPSHTHTPCLMCLAALAPHAPCPPQRARAPRRQTTPRWRGWGPCKSAAHAPISAQRCWRMCCSSSPMHAAARAGMTDSSLDSASVLG